MSATAYWRWRFSRSSEPRRHDSREFKGGYVWCSWDVRAHTRRSEGVRGRISCACVWIRIWLLSGSGYAEFHSQVAQGEDPLKSAMTATLLQLGDSTSRNLEFSHRRDVWVSYGEETITESNLLEIRRRHPELVRIRTFTKRKEAKTGADWEWHIVGRRRTVKMRVQAKRLQCDDVLKVKHKVKSSGRQQRSLLIVGARAARMKPVYCIYSTEQQRTIWTQPKGLPATGLSRLAVCLPTRRTCHSGLGSSTKSSKSAYLGIFCSNQPSRCNGGRKSPNWTMRASFSLFPSNAAVCRSRWTVRQRFHPSPWGGTPLRSMTSMKTPDGISIGTGLRKRRQRIGRGSSPRPMKVGGLFSPTENGSEN